MAREDPVETTGAGEDRQAKGYGATCTLTLKFTRSSSLEMFFTVTFLVAESPTGRKIFSHTGKLPVLVLF